MKKLLAILLAMMLVLVSVAAVAGGVDGDNTNQQTSGENGNENGNGENGNTGNTGNTSNAPAASTAATATDPSVDTGYQAGTTPPAGLDASKNNTVTVYKHFNISGTGAKVPPQTVSFTVGDGVLTVNSNAANITVPAVTIDDVVFTEGNATDDLTKEVKINLLPYSAIGVYTYPVTETDTNVAGVSYASDLELKITVIQGENGLLIAGIALRQKNVKTDTLENDYAAHALTVGKTVSGIMGDQTKYFPITVVLTAPSGDKVYGSVGVTITGTGATVKDGDTPITTTIAAETNGWSTKTLKLSLKHGQTVKFDNLPEGVTYTVIEDSAIVHTSQTQTATEQTNPEAYYVTNEVTTAATLSADATVTIKNDKTVDIDTGVMLETNAYVLIMALALAGFVMMALRRREEY